VLPLIGRAVTGDREAYRYLPDSIAAFRSTAELAAIMNEVGFASVETKALFPSGVATMVVAVRAGEREPSSREPIAGGPGPSGGPVR